MPCDNRAIITYTLLNGSQRTSNARRWDSSAGRVFHRAIASSTLVRGQHTAVQMIGVPLWLMPSSTSHKHLTLIESDRNVAMETVISVTNDNAELQILIRTTYHDPEPPHFVKKRTSGRFPPWGYRTKQNTVLQSSSSHSTRWKYPFRVPYQRYQQSDLRITLVSVYHSLFSPKLRETIRQ